MKISEKEERSVMSMKCMVGIQTADVGRSRRWAKGLSWQIQNYILQGPKK